MLLLIGFALFAPKVYGVLLYIYTGPPVILTNPTSHIVTVGMNVTLYCNVSSAVSVSFVWERRTDSSPWERIDNSQSYKYTVRNIQQTQQYRCVAGNYAGALVSNAATIEVLSKRI